MIALKLMIASDIHGDAACCQRLMEAFEREAPEKLLLLGDLLYHGPRNDLPQDYDPRQTAAMLNEKKEHLLCVRGNCDSEVDQMMLDFPIMADYCLLFWQGKTILATHGHRFNDTHLPPLQAGGMLLCGHTHVPACRESDEILYLNPGSVSIPKEDSCRGYMLLCDAAAEWRDLDGALIRTAQIF